MKNDNSNSSRWLLGFLVLAGAAAYLMLNRGGLGFFGGEPPSIASNGTWLNATEPISLPAMNGKVVWLEFSFMH